MLKNIDDIKKFEVLFKEYEKKEAGYSIEYLSLEKWFVTASQNNNDNRAFIALLDIKLSLSHAFRDMQSAREVWNENFSNGKLEGNTFLDSYPLFCGKMELHRAYASFVLKYRAIWDKLMGFLVLCIVPDAYEKFTGARSRKKRFRDVFSDLPKETADFAEEIFSKVSEFDDKFRTSEAHGTGVLRKYAFQMESLGDSPLVEIIDYWNFLNETIHKVSKTLEAEYKSR